MWGYVHHEDSGSAALLVWGSVYMSMLRLSLETANRLILWHLYGFKTVAYYHPSIIRVKPQLVVSNGDILKGWGFYHYLIGVSLWIPSSLLIVVLVFKYVTPAWWRKQANEGGRMAPGWIGVVGLLVMFFCIPGLLPFAAAMAVGVAVAISGLYWLRAETQGKA